MKLIYLDDHAYSKFIQFDIKNRRKTDPQFLEDHGIKYEIVDEKDLPIWSTHGNLGQGYVQGETYWIRFYDF